MGRLVEAGPHKSHIIIAQVINKNENKIWLFRQRSFATFQAQCAHENSCEDHDPEGPFSN